MNGRSNYMVNPNGTFTQERTFGHKSRLIGLFAEDFAARSVTSQAEFLEFKPVRDGTWTSDNVFWKIL